MSKVLGKNVIAYIFHGGMWKVAICARSCEFTTVTEFIETSVKGAGKYKRFKPTVNSSTGTMEGLVAFNEPDTLALSDLRALQLAQTRLLLRYQRTDEDGNIYTDEVYSYISQTADVGDYKEAANFSLDLIGDGEIVQVFTPTPTTGGTVTRVDFTQTDGQVDLTDPALVGKQLIEFVVDGVGYTLIGAGTPVNKEFKFTAGTGLIEWGIPGTVDTDAYYIYQ